MSRVGKHPVTIPANVKVAVNGSKVNVEVRVQAGLVSVVSSVAPGRWNSMRTPLHGQQEVEQRSI